MFKRIVWLCVSVLSLYSQLAVANAVTQKSVASEDLKGALCLIKADEKIVLINEVLTKTISLPGGTIDNNEQPEDTAQRETWEETGLVVTVGKPLGYTDSAVIFDCTSDSAIIAYEFNNELDGHELPIWFAPHYGVEVASAMLIEPRMLSATFYRYPEQWEGVRGLFEHATEQPVSYVRNLIEAAPPINQIELNWIATFQHSVSAMPDEIGSAFASIIWLVNQLAKPWIMLVLFPLIYWRLGKALSYKIFFAVTVTSLLCLVGQQGFGLPRPHVYIPALALSPTYGFSFPNLTIAVWFSVATLVLHNLDKWSFNKVSYSFLFIMMWLFIAKFYSGSAFLVDMLVGALLGVLASWHIIRLDTKPDIDVKVLLSSKAVWLGLTGITAVLVVLWPIPVFTAWLAVLMTASALVMTMERDKEVASIRQVGVIILSLIAINALLLYAATFVSHSGLISLIFETLRFPILMVLFVFSIRKCTK